MKVKESIQKCIAQIIQHNSLIKNIFHEIYQQQGKVLLVGGAVRDCLLGQSTSDLDFEIYNLSFEHIEQVLKKFGRVSFVGKSFGVLRLHGLDVDWSLPRSDSKGRKPTVAFDPHMSFEQAFKRRDLTINAMGIDVYSLELVDPYDGLYDLQHKILRSPDISFFVQDPLRLFRVMQFVARLHMQVDDTLSQACQTMDISQVSSERIEDEFTKMFLKSNKPSLGFLWLDKIHRLDKLFPDIDFDATLLEAIDYLSVKPIKDNQKLCAMWGFILKGMHQDKEINVSIHEPLNKEQAKVFKIVLKSYVHASKVLQCAISIAGYLSYIPLLIQTNKHAYYKWLAYWFDKIGSLELLGLFASCWYSDKDIDLFIDQAKKAGVLHKPEEPLVIAKDIQHIYQGKELGIALKKAYHIQLEEEISNKELLIQKVVL